MGDTASHLQKGESMTSRLKHLSVASPCKASWSAMSGDARKRFCGDCRRHVYDLSKMTEAEAEALLGTVDSLGRGPCVRFFQRADGTVLTADCPVGVALARRAKARAAAFAGAALALVVGFFGATRAKAGGGDRILMGKVAPRPSATPAAVQGEPEALMGDVAPSVPTPVAPKTKNEKKR